MFLDDTWEYHTTHKKWRYRSSVREARKRSTQYAWDASHLYLLAVPMEVCASTRARILFSSPGRVQRFVAPALNEESALWEAPRRLGRDLTPSRGRTCRGRRTWAAAPAPPAKCAAFGGLCGDESEEPDGLEALGELVVLEYCGGVVVQQNDRQ